MKKRFSEAEAGLPVKELCRKHGFSETSYYLWRSKFGGMGKLGSECIFQCGGWNLGSGARLISRRCPQRLEVNRRPHLPWAELGWMRGGYSVFDSEGYRECRRHS